MKRANMLDVARHAGVSTATVSRVLNSPDRVGEATRNKVLEAIDALKFVKSATAFSFKVQQTNSILVLVSNIGNIYYSEVFEGVYHEAEAHGYSISLAMPKPENVSEQITDHLRAGRVDGVIVLDSLDLTADDFDLLRSIYSGTPPVVGFSEKAGELRYPHVFIDNKKAAITATNCLIEAGHKDIGHITGGDNTAAASERLAGYREALIEAGLTYNADNVFSGGFHRDFGRSTARQLARRTQPPTAMFCASDEMAMGLISELHILGIEVPSDMSVVGFDNMVIADAYVPALTTISQPRGEIGRACMSFLLDVMADPRESDGRVVELEVRLARRASVAPPKSLSDR